jgi:hypothetical protein
MPSFGISIGMLQWQKKHAIRNLDFLNTKQDGTSYLGSPAQG